MSEVRIEARKKSSKWDFMLPGEIDGLADILADDIGRTLDKLERDLEESEEQD